MNRNYLIEERKVHMPKEDTLENYTLEKLIIKDKKPYEFPQEKKDHFVILKAAGAAAVDGAVMAGEYVADAVLGMGVLAKRMVGKKEVMPRLCDDRRAKRAACLIGFLLALSAVFGAYKAGKHYMNQQRVPQPAQVNMVR